MPKLHTYQATLDALNYEINAADQVVDKESGDHFKFFISDNDDVNLMHKDAAHQATRKEVLDRLAKYDVKEIYLTGPHANSFKVDIPGRHIPYVTILATDVPTLSQKSDVVVIVPEHNQDLGVWSYRELMGPGGVERGSVLGLVKQLQGLQLRPAGKTPSESENIVGHMNQFDSAMAAFKDDAASDGPGIVVLNTSELHYSHEDHKSYSIQSWLARPRDHALQPPVQIEEQYNRVDGHNNAQEHVNTVLECILPELTSTEARLYVMTVSDASEYLVNYMNGRLKDPNFKMMVPGRRTKALAFIEPTHNPDNITIELVKLKISDMGKSWVLSDQPLGTKLTAPEEVSPLAQIFEDMIYSDPIAVPRAVARKVTARKKREKSAKEKLRSSKSEQDQQAKRPRALTVGIPPADAKVLSTRPPRSPVPWPSWLKSKLSPPSSTPPSGGSTDASPRDGKALAEMEKLVREAQAKTLKGVFYMDLTAAENLKPGDFVRRTPLPALDGSRNCRGGISGMQTSRCEFITRDFGYPSSPVSLQPRNNGTAGSRDEKNDAGSIGSNEAAGLCDENNDDDAGSVGSNNEAVYSGSEYRDDVQESAKLIGGDFDDGGGGEGLWMKDYKKNFSSTDPVEQSGKNAKASKNYSEKEGVKETEKDSDSESEGDGDSVPSVPELEADVSSASSSDDGVSVGSVCRSEAAVSELSDGAAGGDEGGNEDPDDFSDRDSAGVFTPEPETEEEMSAAMPGRYPRSLSDGTEDDDFASAAEKAEDLGWIDEKGALVKYDSVTSPPDPEIGDMLRVSSGEEKEVELIWARVMGEVLKWFVEMGKKDTR